MPLQKLLTAIFTISLISSCAIARKPIPARYTDKQARFTQIKAKHEINWLMDVEFSFDESSSTGRQLVYYPPSYVLSYRQNQHPAQELEKLAVDENNTALALLFKPPEFFNIKAEVGPTIQAHKSKVSLVGTDWQYRYGLENYLLGITANLETPIMDKLYFSLRPRLTFSNDVVYYRFGAYFSYEPLSSIRLDFGRSFANVDYDEGFSKISIDNENFIYRLDSPIRFKTQAWLMGLSFYF